MNTLEECWENDFSKINFIDRKVKITHPKTILQGASKVGKTYLIYDFLKNFKSEQYLYLDFLDKRNDLLEIKQNLSSFLKQKSIKVLVLENFDFSFELPYCENIIITTKIKKIIKGFKNITLYPLDFEEYLVYENKYYQTTQSFNMFLKYGNLPEIVSIHESKKIIRLQEILKLQSQNQIQYEILKILIENIDEKKSIFQLFNILKSRIKISKDSFYETCKQLEENKTIYFLKKYNQSRAIKKIYSYNYSFIKAISYNKKFKNEFSNMVFLELLTKNEDIFYLDNIDFYVKNKNEAIIAIPFFNNLLINSTVKKIIKVADEFDIGKITIITINNSENIQILSRKIQVLPFYEWALS